MKTIRVCLFSWEEGGGESVFCVCFKGRGVDGGEGE